MAEGADGMVELRDLKLQTSDHFVDRNALSQFLLALCELIHTKTAGDLSGVVPAHAIADGEELYPSSGDPLEQAGAAVRHSRLQRRGQAVPLKQEIVLVVCALSNLR